MNKNVDLSVPNLILWQGDCLEKMKDIADKSVDMVCCDPPYEKTACEWDSIISLEPMWEHLKRVIKFGGVYHKDTRKAGHLLENKGERYPSSVIPVIQNQSGRGQLHPTQKPVALMEYLIKTYTNKGEMVLDFAMGSGTTGVACKKLKRNFVGIELDEEYFEIAKKRIHQAQPYLF